VRTSRFLVGLAGSVAVATFALGGALVSAQTVSDGRAVLVGSPGCPDGTAEIPQGVIQFFFASGPPGQEFTILSVDPGFTVTAIVVTGGGNSQMYNPGARGLSTSPPWPNLLAPLTSDGVLPNIDSWVACGPTTPTTTTTTTVPETTTTTTVPETTTTTTIPGTTTTIPGTTTTQPGSTTTDPGTTTTTIAGPTTTTIAGPTTTAARPTSTLPHTGASSSTNTIGVAVLILLAGAFATLVARRQAG
jgi:LPXTG-motif cell wall-anchored protein